MAIGIFTGAYQRAVRASFQAHLAGLGFSLRKQRSGVLVAESGSVRVIFDPRRFVPLVQRSPVGADERSPTYDVGLLLEAANSDSGSRLPLINSPDAAMAEMSRIVGLLVRDYRPVLDNDDLAWQRIKGLADRREDQMLAQWSEAGLRLKDGCGWRELPEIESVRAKGDNKLVNALVAFVPLAMAGMIVLCLVAAYGILLSDSRDHDTLFLAIVLTVVGVPAIVFAVWLTRKVLRCHYYWETSRTGFTIGRFFGAQVIPWEDVQSAVDLPGAGYEITTVSGSIRLDEKALSNTLLEASVWQHLKRLGKAQTLPLSSLAASLWALIPDERIQEIQWENPRSPQPMQTLLRLVLWEVLIWWFFVYFKLGTEKTPLCFAMSVVLVYWAASSLMEIRSVSVLADEIQASTALRKLRIRWENVRSVRFMDGWCSLPACMWIRAGAAGFVNIPWIPEHPNSTRVMLAIIRRLRQEKRFRFLPFPAVLLMAANRGDSHPYDTPRDR